MSVLSAIGATIAAAGVAGTLAVGSVAGAATAQADTTPSPDAVASRLAQACARVPNRIDRVERLQARLHADGSTKGSLAFLQARIDTAQADGRSDLARVLTDRLAVRKDLDAALPDVLAKLGDARQVCQDHPAASSSTASS